MLSYRAPGVYVEEQASGSHIITAAGTSIAGFVGVAPNPTAHVNQAVPIQNWTEFVNNFVRDGDTSTPLSNAVFGFIQNGGPRCYVVNTGGADEPLVGDGRGGRKGLEVLEPIDEVAIVVAPGSTSAAAYDAITNHCEKLQDRIGILDCPLEFTVDQLTKVGTAKPAAKPAAVSTEPEEAVGLRPPVSDRGFTAFYAPWIYATDPLSPKQSIWMPPSGCVAGIYARTDTERGVHKAPANERVRGALNLSKHFTFEELATLNVNGVNCIRRFPNQGIVLFGARTTALPDNQWRYVNVRRLFCMIETSIGRSTRWAVFEPNDYGLRKSITRDVSAFLKHLWRSGALLGRTPEQAFYVKCDDETNPQDVVDQGMLVTEIGIAPVKPAEFVIFRIAQHSAGTEIAGEGGENA